MRLGDIIAACRRLTISRHCLVGSLHASRAELASRGFCLQDLRRDFILISCRVSGRYFICQRRWRHDVMCFAARLRYSFSHISAARYFRWSFPSFFIDTQQLIRIHYIYILFHSLICPTADDEISRRILQYRRYRHSPRLAAVISRFSRRARSFLMACSRLAPRRHTKPRSLLSALHTGHIVTISFIISASAASAARPLPSRRQLLMLL